MIDKLARFYRSADRIILTSINLSLLSALVCIVLFLLTYSYLPSKVPLFYSRSWGQTQLASQTQLLIIPSLIVLTTLINLIISWHLHSSQLTLKRILSLSSSLIALLFLITAIKITLVFL